MNKRKIKLFPHQIEVLEITKEKRRVAYYLEMGLGKTFVASEKAEQFEENIIVIVCQKSKIKDWQDHYKEYYPQYKIICYKKDVDKIKSDTVIIINYDLLCRRNEFRNIKNFTLILDESSYIKNEKSMRTKFVLSMRPSNVILLSGTPIGGKYEELYSQIKLLDWKISKKEYWDTFINYRLEENNGARYPRVIGYKNIDILKKKLREYGAIFMKTEDVITLPDIMEKMIKIKSIPQYKAFMKDRIVEIKDKELVGDTALKKMICLRQLAGMFNDYKYEKLKQLLEAATDRIIIFYNFDYEFNEIYKICNVLKKAVSVISGKTRDLTNYENHNDSVTLIQYQAGAMGLNLQEANKIIYFSLPLSSELFEQSKKRIHRMGQNKTCFYYYLITEKSIEEKIFKVLKQRKDYTEKLFIDEEIMIS